MVFGFHRLGRNAGGRRRNAGLWTDSRYFAQAERATGRQRRRADETARAAHARALGVAARASARRRRARRAPATGCRWPRNAALRGHWPNAARCCIELDLPGVVWSDRPPLPHAPVYEHPGLLRHPTRAEKLARRAQGHAQARRHATPRFRLDEIAWVLNLRGSDVECNPVFLAHLLVDAKRAPRCSSIASKLERRSGRRWQ